VEIFIQPYSPRERNSVTGAGGPNASHSEIAESSVCVCVHARSASVLFDECLSDLSLSRSLRSGSGFVSRDVRDKMKMDYWKVHWDRPQCGP
jgi:hypothetical protein